MDSAAPALRRRALCLVAALVSLVVAGSASYVIRPGDTLSGIALRTGSSVAALQSANGLSDPDRIVAGERLTIPAGGASGGDAAAGPPDGGGAHGDIGGLLESTARRYGMSPAFVKAVAWQESGWSPTVVSSANAIGVMQVLPSTGEFVSANLVGRSLDLRDPADNVEAGVAFLRHVYRLAGGDVDLTLAGYYQGLRSVRENGMYDDTRRYIANVKALRSRF